MKCAYCAEPILAAPVCGICCSTECSQQFGATLTPAKQEPEPLHPFEQFGQWLAWMYQAPVTTDERGRYVIHG